MASDPDGDPLSYQLDVAPANMTIDADTGLVQWSPTSADLGSHTVLIRVADGRGGSDQQQLTLEVCAAVPNRPPIIVSSPEVDATVATLFELEKVPVGQGPVATLLDDFTGDGAPTLVSANPGSQTISLAPVTGTAAFGPATDVSVGEPPPAVTKSLVEGLATVPLGFADLNANNPVLGLARGDFNQDGFLDVAAVFRESVSGYKGRLSISLGHGDGTFGDPQVIPLPSVSAGILAKDFDRDGRLDLVVAATDAKQIVFLGGQGDGTFAAPLTSDMAESPDDLQTADLNGDQILDLVSINATQKTFTTLLGAGDGTFGDAVTYDASQSSPRLDLVLADLDQIHGPDVIVAGNTGYGKLQVFLNDGTGALGVPSEIPTPNAETGFGTAQVEVIHAGDFDGDGKVDLVYNRYGSPLGFLHGNGDGTFADVVPGTDHDMDSLAIQSHVEQVATDLNDDGYLDLLLGHESNSNLLTVALGNGDGTFRTMQYLASPGSGIPDAADWLEGAPPTGVLPGDFNADGITDLVVMSEGGGTERPGGVALILGSVPGEFLSPQPYPTSRDFSWPGHALADFNNDGLIDLAQITGAVDVSLGQGDGTFGAPFPAISTGFYGITLRSADFDRDGNQDLVWNWAGRVQGAP